jgi:hypothetical protein
VIADFAEHVDAILKPKPGPKPAPSCSDGVDSKSCKDITGCVWCEATFGPGKKPKGSCYDEVTVMCHLKGHSCRTLSASAASTAVPRNMRCRPKCGADKQQGVTAWSVLHNSLQSCRNRATFVVFAPTSSHLASPAACPDKFSCCFGCCCLLIPACAGQCSLAACHLQVLKALIR